MSKILPVSELTKYNRVLSNVTYDNPVYLTKDGMIKYIIQDIKVQKEYEEMKAILTLLLNLKEGELSSKDKGYINIEDVRKRYL